MKIELKSIKFSETLSEETNAFTANLYIDGKKVGYCKNTGQGGCTDYYGIEKHRSDIIVEAEAYCKTLPKVKFHDTEWEQSLEGVIDQLFEDWLDAKETKRMQKKMQTCILVGSPDENRSSYSCYNFKRPLSTVPTKALQASIDRIVAKLEHGEVILNTNLIELEVYVNPLNKIMS